MTQARANSRNRNSHESFCWQEWWAWIMTFMLSQCTVLTFYLLHLTFLTLTVSLHDLYVYVYVLVLGETWLVLPLRFPSDLTICRLFLNQRCSFSFHEQTNKPIKAYFADNRSPAKTKVNIKTLISRFSFLGSVRSSGSQSVFLSVRLSGTSLSKALNLHLSLIGLGQICLRSRSVLGQSQVSLRSLCAYFIRKKEPKILRLVEYYCLKMMSRTHEYGND